MGQLVQKVDLEVLDIDNLDDFNSKAVVKIHYQLLQEGFWPWSSTAQLKHKTIFREFLLTKNGWYLLEESQEPKRFPAKIAIKDGEDTIYFFPSALYAAWREKALQDHANALIAERRKNQHRECNLSECQNSSCSNWITIIWCDRERHFCCPTHAILYLSHPTRHDPDADEIKETGITA